MGPVRPHFHFMAIHCMEKISSVLTIKFHLFCSPIEAPVCMFPKDQRTSRDNHGLRCAEKVIQESPRAITVSSFMFLLSLVRLLHSLTVSDISFYKFEIFLTCWFCALPGSCQLLHHICHRFHCNFLKILQKTLEYLCDHKMHINPILDRQKRKSKNKDEKQGKELHR